MILIKALFAGLLILVAGLNCLTETTALAQTEPIQLTDVKLDAYELPGGVWVDVNPPGMPQRRVLASAIKLRFKARVNRMPRTWVLLKGVMHEVCFRRDNSSFANRFRYVESTTPNPQRVGLNGEVFVEIGSNCVQCRTRCNRGCDDREHLGEGPHLATLTVADPEEPAGSNENGFLSPTYRVEFETECPPRRARAPRTKKD